MFQFVNSYTSLFYVAFIKNGVDLWGLPNFKDSCKYGSANPNSSGCINELTVQLGTVLGTNVVVGQLQVTSSRNVVDMEGTRFALDSKQLEETLEQVFVQGKTTSGDIPACNHG